MGPDFFENLPLEMITNILTRLPIRTIAISKCVRKSWLDLVETDEFVKLHLSRSAAALAVFTPEDDSTWCVFFELQEEIDAESSRDHHYNHLTNFDFPHLINIEGSVNGMLLLQQNVYDLDAEVNVDALYVCNPITREYFELHCPEGFFIPRGVIYGFGTSKITGQHKVVRIITKSDCNVYTLGTGSWRCIEAPSASFSYDLRNCSAFVNGNLHWLARDSSSDSSTLICCFDLETECFSTFSVPPLQGYVELSVLRDCVCLCDAVEDENIALIWLMKEYGDEKSWKKEYVINFNPGFDRTRRISVYASISVYAINVFKDGDILMVLGGELLSYYSSKTKTIQEIGVIDRGESSLDSMLYTPSFLSIKSFPLENVIPL